MVIGTNEQHGQDDRESSNEQRHLPSPSYTWSMPKRFQIRPPGLKPTTKVGTIGPYRGRLGLAWVIAPIVAGLVIVVAAYFALYH